AILPAVFIGKPAPFLAIAFGFWNFAKLNLLSQERAAIPAPANNLHVDWRSLNRSPRLAVLLRRILRMPVNQVAHGSNGIAFDVAALDHHAFVQHCFVPLVLLRGG